ncbi:hypothetical protein ACWDY7_16920 [Streptomyces calvus]|uniref:Uncharacterized protein n=1 Tax=Streptomyces calvus TaxID=67282 RepID=A0AA40VDP1_9ACTN|nr:hypothetical protein [Streptomyces calvus]MBA8942017.1 hypothetical protein [Streptomyces calvus]GGP53425.1 hypothetical protein GCM10010247_27690 [Streptomyces calvus]
MSLTFHRNPDGTTTGRNDANGFTVTHADEEEVKRQLYEDAGWEYTPPPPPVPPGHHRFSLVHDEFRTAGSRTSGMQGCGRARRRGVYRSTGGGSP